MCRLKWSIVETWKFSANPGLAGPTRNHGFASGIRQVSATLCSIRSVRNATTCCPAFLVTRGCRSGTDGHLLLLGFNPYSQFGLRRSFGRSVPWNGNTYSRARIQDWLSVLGYRIVTAETVFLRTPIDRPGFLRRTRYIEHTQRFFGFVGGVYLIHARKQSIPMTITRQSWMRPQGRLVTGAFAQRSTRSSVNRSTASPDKDRTE